MIISEFVTQHEINTVILRTDENSDYIEEAHRTERIGFDTRAVSSDSFSRGKLFWHIFLSRSRRPVTRYWWKAFYQAEVRVLSLIKIGNFVFHLWAIRGMNSVLLRRCIWMTNYDFNINGGSVMKIYFLLVIETHVRMTWMMSPRIPLCRIGHSDVSQIERRRHSRPG